MLSVVTSAMIIRNRIRNPWMNFKEVKIKLPGKIFLAKFRFKSFFQLRLCMFGFINQRIFRWIRISSRISVVFTLMMLAIFSSLLFFLQGGLLWLDNSNEFYFLTTMKRIMTSNQEKIGKQSTYIKIEENNNKKNQYNRFWIDRGIIHS